MVNDVVLLKLKPLFMSPTESPLGPREERGLTKDF